MSRTVEGNKPTILSNAKCPSLGRTSSGRTKLFKKKELYHSSGSFRNAARVAVVQMCCSQTPVAPRNGRTPLATLIPAPVTKTTRFWPVTMSFARLATLLIFPLADFRGRRWWWCKCLPLLLLLLLSLWSSLLLLSSSQLLRFRSVSAESLPSPDSSSSVSNSPSVPSPSSIPAAAADPVVSTAAGFLSCSSSWWSDGADTDDDDDDEHVEEVDEIQRKPAVVAGLVVCSIVASPPPPPPPDDDVGEVSPLHPAAAPAALAGAS
mmetsp:Transcript_25048/g.59529  ORF Transcript_25048/g.59529 Transcript_25048/m.59529 type:complete len:264 (-) Transcript_25048:631-1422(-)